MGKYIIALLLAPCLSFAQERDQNRVDQLNDLFKNTLNQDPIRALGYTKEALEIADFINYDKGIADAYNNMGVIQNRIGNLDKALEYFFDSRRLQQAIANPDGLAASLNNIGTVYSSKKDYDKALDYFLDAYRIIEKLQDTARIIGSLNNIGNIHLAKNEDGLAMEYYRGSLALYDSLDHKYQVFDPHTNVGNIYFRNNQLDSALYHYNKSLQIEKTNENRAGEAQALNNIGITYAQLKRYQLSVNYLVDALQIAQSINSKPLLMEFYKSLSDNYFNQRNWLLAKDYLLLHGMVKDSIYNEESNRIISELGRTFEMEQQEQQIELLQKESEIQQLQLKNNRNSILAIVFGAGVLFCLVIFYYLKNQSNQKIQALLAAKNKEITESIHYAQSVQSAILDEESIRRSFPESFILYKPKDIVSGDFYWHGKLNGYDILASVDCTGHGVAGAFMTVIGNSLLNQIVVEEQETIPAEILKKLDAKLRKTLKDKQVDISKHGMDIAICKIDNTLKKLSFAGARSDLYYVREGMINEIKGDRHTIGENLNDDIRDFQQKEIDFQCNDIYYLSSDGFADQFGEFSNKKYMKKKFKELLESIHAQNLVKQGQLLEQELEQWQGKLEQTDDILVMGVKLT
jgi:serine phosphatase RsbU (regulator of sigma subunit)/Tfp pilus assembly protein PilF